MGGIFSALLMMAILILTPTMNHANFAAQQAQVRHSPDEIESEEGEQTGVPDGSIVAVGHHALFSVRARIEHWTFTHVEITKGAIREGIIEMEVDLNSLKTPLFWLTPMLKGPLFLDTERYPVAEVKIFEIRPQQISLYGIGHYKATLQLHVRDTTKRYEIDFEITESAPIRAKGAFTIQRSELGLGSPLHPLDILAMRDEVDVRFDLQISAEIKPGGFFIFGYPDQN